MVTPPSPTASSLAPSCGYQRRDQHSLVSHPVQPAAARSISELSVPPARSESPRLGRKERLQHSSPRSRPPTMSLILAGQAIPGLVVLVPHIVAMQRLHLTNSLIRPRHCLLAARVARFRLHAALSNARPPCRDRGVGHGRRLFPGGRRAQDNCAPSSPEHHRSRRFQIHSRLGRVPLALSLLTSSLGEDSPRSACRLCLASIPCQ